MEDYKLTESDEHLIKIMIEKAPADSLPKWEKQLENRKEELKYSEKQLQSSQRAVLLYQAIVDHIKGP